MKRPGLLAVSVVALSGCGQSGPFAAKPLRELEAVSVPTLERPGDPADASPPRRPAGVVGALENVGALGNAFVALSTLDDGGALDDVRVVQFGDSHTAADLESAVVRKALQARFGDGGRGFVAIGKPWKGYLQDGLRAPGMSREFSAERGKLDHGKFVGDGCYGLGGVCVVASKKGARAWTEVAAASSGVEVAYLEQPGGGTFELLVDGAVTATVSTKGAAVASAFKAVLVPEGPHRVEVQAAGDGEVRVFGASLDRSRLGVVWDAVGINGARASTALQWSEAHMSEQLRHRAPGLVVVAYGTNESVDDAALPSHERHLVDLLGRIARALPAASCLVLGPPDRATLAGADWSTAPSLQQVVEMERAVAHAAGCAFYDQLAAMGGPGTIAAWASEAVPRAQRDRVHLTRDGYAFVGQLFADDLVRAYGEWRSSRGLQPGVTPPERQQVPPSNTAPEDHFEKPPAVSPFVAIPM